MNAMQTTKFVGVTPPAAIVDNASFTTAEIDTVGYDYCTIYVYLGATDIAMDALKVQESDTTGAGFADVDGLDFSGDTDVGGSAATLPSATDDDKCFAFEIDLRGRKRFLDVVATAGNGAAGTFASISALLSKGDESKQDVTSRNFGNILRV